MNSNLPPDAAFDQDSGTQHRMPHDAHSGDVGVNPYLEQQQGKFSPDLDAGAPTLRSNEDQRLNRKALLFLGGIVALLVTIGLVLYGKAFSGKGNEKPKQEEVSVPNLPDAPLVTAPAPAMPPAEPIELVPPLPPEPAAQARPHYGASRDEREGPSLMERRMASAGESVGNNYPANRQSQAQAGIDAYAQAMLGMLPASQANAGNRSQADDSATSASYISHPDALLVRGTYIRCVLETRIVTDIPGFTSCVVTEPIYSINGRSLLLPKGSKISGKYESDANGPRISVIWDRITTPNGIDVNMSSPGIDNLGGAGHPGRYNAHWGSRIGSALLVSLIADAFKYEAAEHGPQTSTIGNGGVVVQSPYESATARTMERMANQALSQSMGRKPTVTINQGTVVNVYVARDVDFSAVLAKN